MKKPDYGLDAPKAVFLYTFIGILILIASLPLFYLIHPSFPFMSRLVIGILVLSACFVLYPAITIIIGSRILKFRERDWLLNLIPIGEDQSVLDVGCGRGLLLIGIAKRLKTGKAIGIDIWRTDDQAKNSLDATLENAHLEGVSNKIEVFTADARKIPFEANTFDLVISSWALHNIADVKERELALSEIRRVLKPGGIVAIMDIYYFYQYTDFFKLNHFTNIELLGPRYTFGNATYIVKATKNCS